MAFKRLTHFKYLFSDAVCNARNERELTQEQIAAICDISVRGYQNIEKGKHLPNLVTAIRLILFFDISLEYFREVLFQDDPISMH